MKVGLKEIPKQVEFIFHQRKLEKQISEDPYGVWDNNIESEYQRWKTHGTAQVSEKRQRKNQTQSPEEFRIPWREDAEPVEGKRNESTSEEEP